MFKSTHHSFDIDLAAKYGIEEAIMIHHFQHWVRINQNLERNQHEGRTWTYQTLDEIAAHFPYWSRSQIVDLIERLCTGKNRKSKKTELDFEPVLMKGNFNKHNYDRTIWYAFINEKMFTVLGNPKMDSGKSQNGDWEIPTPIPDTKPDAEEKKKTTKEKTSKKIAVGNRGGGVFFDRSLQEFKNITDEWLAELKRTFPGMDIARQLALMRLWLIDPDNPRRIGNSKFIVGWLSRQIPISGNFDTSVRFTMQPEPVLPVNPHLQRPPDEDDI